MFAACSRKQNIFKCGKNIHVFVLLHKLKTVNYLIGASLNCINPLLCLINNISGYNFLWHGKIMYYNSSFR